MTNIIVQDWDVVDGFFKVEAIDYAYFRWTHYHGYTVVVRVKIPIVWIDVKGIKVPQIESFAHIDRNFRRCFGDFHANRYFQFFNQFLRENYGAC